MPKKPLKKSSKSANPAAKPYTISAGRAELELSVKSEGLEPIFGAAYLMMDRAYVSLSGDRAKSVRVSLEPKDAKVKTPRALAEEFLSDLAGQKVRWAIAKNNQPIREHIAEQAVVLVNNPPAPAPQAAPEPAAEQLTDDQRAEIERLIAEVEAEIKTMNDKKTNADPKNIKASWEEKQEQGNKS